MSAIFRRAALEYREMRQEFDLVLEAAYAKAEAGTGGAMLNALGRSRGVDAYSLLMGHWRRVELYGTPELVEYFREQGRPSVSDFEAQWLANREEVA